MIDNEHVLSDEVFAMAVAALSQGKNWVAYNEDVYFLEREDVYFFTKESAAITYSTNDIMHYKIIQARSVDELMRQITYGANVEKFLLNKSFIMNEKNYDYLANQLKYTGFGEGLQQPLKEKMDLQEKDFTLNFQKSFGKDEVAATLHFKKSEETEMYFFNRYSTTLKNEKFPDPLTQTFYINPKQENITLKEAYNLLSGRAVHKELSNKEGERYKAWLQIDFKDTDAGGNHKMKQFHQNYGYDMTVVLASYPIKELKQDENKQKLIESLERGNRQSVTMDLGGKESKMFIEASPQFKSMNLFDADMKRMTKMNLTEMKNSQEQTMKVAHKQGVENDGGTVEPKKKGGKRKQKID
jgi:hypothetical protein